MYMHVHTTLSLCFNTAVTRQKATIKTHGVHNSDLGFMGYQNCETKIITIATQTTFTTFQPCYSCETL